MSLERSQVLPVGFYWYDAIGDRIAPFLAWQHQNASLVTVRGTREHLDAEPPRTWFLFEVKHPAVWLDQAKFGFPSHGKAGMSEGDTVDNEPTKDATDQIADAVNASTVIEAAKTFSWVAALALGLWGLSKLKK